MCSPAHQKTKLCLAINQPSAWRGDLPFPRLMWLRAGEHLRHLLTAEPEQLPSRKQCIPAHGSLTGEHFDLDLGNKLAKETKKKRNTSCPSRHLWQNS